MGHTKGPWEVDGNINGSAGVISEEGYWVVEPHWISTETGMANLHLIAAAPDLLEALLRVRADLCRRHSPFIVESDYAYLSEAMNKATAQREGEE